MRYTIVCGLIAVALLNSCALNLLPAQFSLASPTLRSAAYESAETWLGVKYRYGGQSRGGVDCSGLVVEVYHAAAAQHGFGIPFEDANVYDLRTQYTVEISSPEQGDLIFMGDGEITHVAIFEKEEAGYVYFIDAFEETASVEYRSYPAATTKIHFYARMLVYEK